MHNGMQSSSNDHYHFVKNNSGRSTNGNWDGGGRHEQGQNHKNLFRGGRERIGDEGETFTKFRDANQDQQFQTQQRQSGRRRGGGGGGEGGGGRRSGGGGEGGGGRRSGGGGGHDRGRRRRRGGGGGGSRGGRGGGDQRSPWYKEPLPSDIFYFTNGQLPQEDTAEHATEPRVTTPLPASIPTVPAAAMSPALPLPVCQVSEPPKETSSTTLNNAVVTKSPALLHVANIKKEKKDSWPKQPAKQQESSSDSPSSSSDESVEAGEIVKPTPAKKAETTVPLRAKVKTEIAAKPAASSSSSEDDSSSDDNSAPSKVKSAINESKTKSNLKKTASEEDVVCMGVQNRNFTIPDEDESEDEDEEAATTSESETSPKKKVSKGKNKPQICGICEKKGHTSFECQMICMNCSAPHHSLKNCPNPPNLNIALQAFMEFTMQQLTVFHMDKRFSFPAGVVTAPSAPIVETQAPVASKSKKEKRSLKKSKKTPKKKVKIEARDSDDDDDDNDDDVDEASATTESESSESSADNQISKSKRKRNSKQVKQSATNMAPATAYPFPMLAAGAPYNPLMYPYGAAFSFPK